MNNSVFPFTAVVEQKELKQALLVNGVDPSIGGVLVRGARGTGKSTLVRAFAQILPPQRFVKGCPFRCRPEQDPRDCPSCTTSGSTPVQSDRPRFVDLPLGATPDNITGTLDVEMALKQGEQQLNPGLLARANRGVLYVDEVNLLPDPLVDLILDAAASGVNRVERDGISIQHPSRFILIGTMNPEEGGLRPQLQDRFGLCAEVQSLTDPQQRMEITRRAVAFDRTPDRFRKQWDDQQETIRERMVEARERLSDVQLQQEQERWIAERVLERRAQGHRADIVIRKTAEALAAWHQRNRVQEEDLELAARLALQHRTPRSPDPSPDPGPPEDRDPFGEHRGSGSNGEDTEPDQQNSWIPPSSEGQLRLRSGPDPSHRGPENPALMDPEPPGRQRGRSGSLDLAETLRRAARRSSAAATDWSLEPEDVCFRERPRMKQRLTVLVVDASGSMIEKNQLGVLKGSLQRLLQNPVTEEWFSLVAFRGSRAQIMVPPTRRVHRLCTALEDLPAGGETPMRKGLSRAGVVLDEFTRDRPRWSTRLVVLSDGRLPLSGGLVGDLTRLRERTSVTLVDTDQTGRGWGNMKPLARQSGCRYVPLKQYVA